MSNLQTPSIGRVVQYSLDDGTVRPAVIVQVWQSDPETATVNLQVLLDGSNDMGHETKKTGVSAEEAARGMAWRTSRQVSTEPKPGRWHWPPYVGSKA